MKLQEIEPLIPADLEPVEVFLRHGEVTKCYLRRKEDNARFIIDAKGKASRFEPKIKRFLPEPEYDLKK